MNTTILQLVAIYMIQHNVSVLYVGHHEVVQRTYQVATHIVWSLNKFFGQPDDGLHTGPKHVVVSYILLQIVILLCS